MFESSTYRYIFEQGQQEIAVENILSFLDARFGIGTDETLQRLVKTDIYFQTHV